MRPNPSFRRTLSVVCAWGGQLVAHQSTVSVSSSDAPTDAVHMPETDPGDDRRSNLSAQRPSEVARAFEAQLDGSHLPSCRPPAVISAPVCLDFRS